MKVAIFTRTDSSKIENLITQLKHYPIDYQINPQIDQLGRFDIAVTLGGDGTFLDAVRQMGLCCDLSSQSYLPLLGINIGRLGFLATISMEECRDAFDALLSNKYTIEERTMLKINGIEPVQARYAINEFTVQKHGVSMIETQITIDGVEVATYWADGVIISTPTGSTAYSMSVGGSILTPQSPCFIISPVAPHNLSLRPLVVHDTATIELRVRSRFDEGITVTVDNSSYSALNEQNFTIQKSDNKLKIINIGNTNFYNTLRQKLHWGVDLRN